MKNKKLPVIIAAIGILMVSFVIGTGFTKRTDVILTDYSVSEDGAEIILKTSVASSAGYIRGFKNDGGGVKPHYLTFYTTFGGPNSTFGAKNEFVLEVDEDDSEVYFNRADGGYELVLQKDAQTGVWGKTP